MKEQITELTHPNIFAWFTKYGSKSLDLNNPKNGFENGKMNLIKTIYFEESLQYIKYSHGDVVGFNVSTTNNMFLINSPKKIKNDFGYDDSRFLLSFKGFPKKVDGDHVGVWDVFSNEQYSLDYKKNDKYKLYLAMWLEMLDSVTEKERWEYINEFKSKSNVGNSYSIIPKEILLEFGVV